MSKTQHLRRHPNSPRQQSIKEFVAGCMGGFAQVLFGQPFDIIKVRLQTQGTGSAAQYSGMVDAAKKIFKKEGGFAFYKGSVAPLIGVGAAVSIQFGVVEICKRFFQSIVGKDKPLPLHYVTLSGAIAGMANSIVSISAEHIRIRMQIQTPDSGKPAEYRGSYDAIKKIYSKYGIPGIYKGTYVTLIRELISYGIYFTVYDFTIRRMRKPDQKGLPMTHSLLAGALSGYAYWTIVYPIDVVKTKLQTDSFEKPEFKGAIDCARKTYRQFGIKGFFNGFTPCILRAGPVNGGGFLVFEAALKILGSNPRP